MGFFELLRDSLNRFFGTIEEQKLETGKPHRARDSKGRYLGDDPDTPEDEAWILVDSIDDPPPFPYEKG